MFSHALSDVIWLDIIWALGPVAPIIMSALLKKAFEDDADETSNQFDFKQ